MPGIARGYHAHCVEFELSQRRFQQGPMRQVRRVEGAAKHPDTSALGWFQTQSRRTKNLLYNSASGVPAAGTCW